MDANGYSDPYVKLKLIPSNDHNKRNNSYKKKTSIKEKNLNPVWDETLEMFVVVLIRYIIF